VVIREEEDGGHYFAKATQCRGRTTEDRGKTADNRQRAKDIVHFPVKIGKIFKNFRPKTMVVAHKNPNF